MEAAVCRTTVAMVKPQTSLNSQVYLIRMEVARCVWKSARVMFLN